MFQLVLQLVLRIGDCWIVWFGFVCLCDQVFGFGQIVVGVGQGVVQCIVGVDVGGFEFEQMMQVSDGLIDFFGLGVGQVVFVEQVWIVWYYLQGVVECYFCLWVLLFGYVQVCVCFVGFVQLFGLVEICGFELVEQFVCFGFFVLCMQDYCVVQVGVEGMWIFVGYLVVLGQCFIFQFLYFS